MRRYGSLINIDPSMLKKERSAFGQSFMSLLKSMEERGRNAEYLS